MLSIIDKEIQGILILKLNGYTDICNKIIAIKNELFFDDMKNEHMKKDFYNWLSYDIYLKNWMSKLRLDYLDLQENEKEAFVRKNVDLNNYSKLLLNVYFNYYDIYKNIGLNEIYIRTKSLAEYFNSKWWMTTEKNSIHWNDMHQTIKFPLVVKIYNKTFRSNIWRFDRLLDELINNPDEFRNPTIKERYKIIHKFDFYYYNQHITPLSELGFEQDFDSGYLIVDREFCIF
jgi:hypothetical protein